MSASPAFCALFLAAIVATTFALRKRACLLILLIAAAGFIGLSCGSLAHVPIEKLYIQTVVNAIASVASFISGYPVPDMQDVATNFVREVCSCATAIVGV